jgi:hypothetical protein
MAGLGEGGGILPEEALLPASGKMRLVKVFIVILIS